MKYLPHLFLFIILPVFIQAQHEPDVPPPAERGLYAIWYSKDGHLLNLPYIKGGQIVFQWATNQTVCIEELFPSFLFIAVNFDVI